MIYSSNRLMRDPDDKNNPAAKPEDTANKEVTPTDSTDEIPEEEPLAEKVKEALQDWSNKDQADQDFDDTRV